ncbi:MAG: TerB family tellurite resistance protein [Woeseiaceae bacterium]
MNSEILGSRIVGSTLIVETGDGEERYDEKFLVAAILIYVARGSGRIEQEESSLIIDLIEEHFNLQGAESLELISRALEETTDKPALADLLVGLAPTLTDAEKEDIAFMGLRVVAADGRRQVSELEQFSKAMGAMGISPDIVHRAFDRYFDQTMPGS